MLSSGLGAGGAGDAVLGSQRREKGWGVVVDGELLERLGGTQCPEGRRSGKELLCLCRGAAREPERVKDAGEGG